MALRSAHAVQRIRLRQLRPADRVKRHERKTARRHNESAAHIVFIRDVAGQFRQHRAAHNRHDDERRGFLRLRAQPINAQRKNRREHDGHEEITREHSRHRHPAEIRENEQADDDVQNGVKAKHLVRGKFLEQSRARNSANQKADERRRGQRGRALIADVQMSVRARFQQAFQPARTPRVRNRRNHCETSLFVNRHAVDEETENARLRRDVEKLRGHGH